MDVSLVEEIECGGEWEPLLKLVTLTSYRLSPVNRVVYWVYNRQGDWPTRVLYAREA